MTKHPIQFQFATASHIIFENGAIRQLPQLTKALGRRPLVVTGQAENRWSKPIDSLRDAGLDISQFAIAGEPTLQTVTDGRDIAIANHCDLIIGIGGGSVIDAAKAIAALATNRDSPMHYLEVIGDGNPLREHPLPCIAAPTTAGTGSEVTRNAVLRSPTSRVKVSLRHSKMLPDIALIDPELTHSVPPDITAYTGMDALTQVIEPYLSQKHNPLTDGICKEGMLYAARSIRNAFESADNSSAREDMAFASVCGGIALANAGLGAVHGIAGPLGGMLAIPHGAICARLLPFVMNANFEALKTVDSSHALVRRFNEVAIMLTGNPTATARDAFDWIHELSNDIGIKPLGDYGLSEKDFPELIEKSQRSSSMKGNPVALDAGALRMILEMAL